MKKVQEKRHWLYSGFIMGHVFCLDVVFIALLWQEWVGQIIGESLPWGPRVVLAMAVWLVYMGDHILDVHKAGDAKLHSSRYQVLSEFMRPILFLYVVIFSLSVLTALRELSEVQFLHGLAVFGLCSIYMGFIARGRLFGKEIAVAVIFWIGVQLFYYKPAMLSIDEYGWFSVALLLMLYANACLVAYWERNEDSAQGASSVATYWPEGGKWLRLAVVFLGLVCLVMPATWPIAVSSIMLFLLDLFKKKVSGQTMRILGDLTLVSPIFFIFL